MKNLTQQSVNKVNLAGKLLDASFGSGKLADGRNYERANVTIRVTQSYSGKEETSEIPVSIFATEYTSTGKPNPALRNLQELKMMNTAQNVGFNAAASVRMNGASLQENNFVSRNGLLINGWQIRGSFISEANASDVASFSTDIFIMDMHDELDKEGDPTGRLVIKGGVVQWGGRLDVLEFFAEAPDIVEYISRNWEVNTTVNVRGRIRVTSQEEERMTGGWGEDIPDVTTRHIRELIITKGDDGPREEDLAYDPVEIKKAFNERKAYIEQLQQTARTTSARQGAGSANAPSTAADKYSWE